MAVVDAQGAVAVAEDVGDAGEQDDTALAAGDGAREAELLREGERRGRVDAALGDGGAEDGLDLALVALDDVEVTAGEEGLDGLPAEGRCSGPAIRGTGVSSLVAWRCVGV